MGSWKPAVGDRVIIDVVGLTAVGTVHRVGECSIGVTHQWPGDPESGPWRTCVDLAHVRPATPAEMASLELDEEPGL